LKVSASRPTSSAAFGTGTRSSSRSTLICRALAVTAATGRSARLASTQPVAAATSRAIGPPVSRITSSRCTAVSMLSSEVAMTSTRRWSRSLNGRASSRYRMCAGPSGTVVSMVCPASTVPIWAGESIGRSAIASSEVSTTVPLADRSCAPESVGSPDSTELLSSVNSPPAALLAW
jgi:hypothetical protein